MGKVTNITQTVGNTEFDWSAYEDGWNGKSLRVNKRIKHNNKNIKVYSHESYAADLFEKYSCTAAPVSKELVKNTVVSIDDFSYVDKHTVLASINGGSNNVVIDLNKEQRFFNVLSDGEDRLNKESFLKCLEDPDVRAKILSMGLVAKVGTDVAKASIWDGYVEKLSTEMKEQVYKKDKAYMAKILSSNNGGFVVEVADTITAFMPGSMAAANKLTNYEALVGQTMEVMVESHDEKLGFVVSRKKYLRTITPIYMRKLESMVKENPDTLFAGKVTGTTPFGIFIELNDFSGTLTGMIHKTLLSDDLREQLRQNKVEADTVYNVYVHKIEKGRIIFSDVPTAERQEVIARREAEDLQEKSAYVAAKKESQQLPQINTADAGIQLETSAE